MKQKSESYKPSTRNKMYQTNEHNLILMDAVMEKLAEGREELTALLRSGQYFTVLATRLDKLSAQIKGPHSDVYTTELQRVVDELLFAQQHYRVKKKLKRS